MAEKNCLDATKLSFHYHVCHCGAVVRELLAPADKPGSTPGDAIFCFFVLFFLFGLFFKHYFSFWPFFLYSYCWSRWSCTWINIYFKLKSAVLFWKRDFKSPWSAYWPSLRPEKKHKLSRHVPRLKRLNFFSMLVDVVTNNTQYTTKCTNLHPTPASGDQLAKVNCLLYIVLIISLITLKSPLG